MKSYLLKPFLKFITALLFFTSVQAAVAQERLRVPVSLNGAWAFLNDPEETGLAQGWDAGLPAKAQVVQVPHTWNIMKGLENYNGLAWYQKKFTVPMDFKNKHIQLKFGAVYHDAVIYLNGNKSCKTKP